MDFSTARGKAAMEAEKRRSSRQNAFCPEIRWREDGDIKYVAFLNPVDLITTVDIHQFVPVDKFPSGKPKFEQFIDRRDPCIGEDYDDLSDRLEHAPVRRTLAVAVELEPSYRVVQGRKRPTGFEVKLREFTRQNENGDEEVAYAPEIGLVSQSKFNFFGYLGNFDTQTAPIEGVAFQIVRRGSLTTTTYDFTPFLDQEIDYSNLFKHLKNVNYLRDSEVDMEADLEPSLEVALQIGEVFLDKRLNELGDKERYDALVGPIEQIDPQYNKFGKKPPKETSVSVVTEGAEVVAGNGLYKTKFDQFKEQFNNTGE